MVKISAWSALIAAISFAAACLGQSDTRQAEVRIKAAFLYRFGEFVEWPPAALGRSDGTFTIGVLGADELAAELERVVANRTIQGRPVAVKRIRRGESIGALQILFVAEAESSRSPEMLADARRNAVLTVTEGNQGLASGSVISFVTDDERVRFDVALPAAERSRLKISSRLLAVARKVVTNS